MILLALTPLVTGEWRLLTDPTVPSENISVGRVEFERGLLPQDLATTSSTTRGNFETTARPAHTFGLHRVWGSSVEVPPLWTADYTPIQNTSASIIAPWQSVIHTSSERVVVVWSYDHWYGVEDWGFVPSGSQQVQTVETRRMEKRDNFSGLLEIRTIRINK